METKDKLDYCFKILQEIDKKTDEDSSGKEKHVICFRGHEKNTYHIEPSIFRDIHDIQLSEHDLVYYILRKHNNEFVGMKPIEMLAKMQHMEIPTRLLDVTFNPLVADFFAVTSFKKKQNDKDTECIKPNENNSKEGIDSEVLAFKICQKDLKNFDSDTVKGLSVIPMLKEHEKRDLLCDLLNDYLIQCVATNLIEENKFFSMQLSGIKNEIRKCFLGYVYLLSKISKYEGDGIQKYFIEAFGQKLDCTSTKDSVDEEYLIWDEGQEEGEKKETTYFYITISPVDKSKMLAKNFKPQNIKLNVYMYNGYGSNDTKGKKFLYSFFNPIAVGNTYIININPILINRKLSEFLASYIDKQESVYFDGENYCYSAAMDQLYYCVQKYYPEYRACSKPLDLINGVFVNPIINTDRMRSQQGAFALFGLFKNWNLIKYVKILELYDKGISYDKIIEKVLNNEGQLSFTDEEELFNVERLKITNKELVRKRLNFLGINKETLGCGLNTTYYNFVDELLDGRNEP